MQGEDTYSVKEAAELLNRTPGRIRQLLRGGELEGYREEGTPSGPWRIPRHEVHALLREECPGRSSETPAVALGAFESAAELRERVEVLMRELARAEARAESEERVASTLRAQRVQLLAERNALRERAQRLERELAELRGRGFWQRLFGG